MDGFGTNTGVIILAATNRVDVLDQALLRAGRFDRQIHVDLPDLPERVAIFKVHLAPLKLQDGLDIELLARQTRVMTQEEKRSIAIHEAGHASVSWLLEYANPLVKVTIVPRGQSLGAAWYLPEERTIITREQMLDEMCATLAGRAAEEVVLGRISSGALNDLERVTQRAYGMVAFLGMSERMPNLSYYNPQETFQKPYSDETARIIDQEVQKLIDEQYARAKRILTENADKHKALADLLCEHEVIFAADVENIFGARPWRSRADIILEEQPLPAETPAAEGETSAPQAAEEPTISAHLPNAAE